MVHFIVLKLCAHAEREIVKILHIVFALRNCYFYDLVCVPSGSGGEWGNGRQFEKYYVSGDEQVGR